MSPETRQTLAVVFLVVGLVGIGGSIAFGYAVDEARGFLDIAIKVGAFLATLVGAIFKGRKEK